jgi:hypothetical protein
MNEPDAFAPDFPQVGQAASGGNAYFAFRVQTVIISDPIFPYNQAILFQGDPS